MLCYEWHQAFLRKSLFCKVRQSASGPDIAVCWRCCTAASIFASRALFVILVWPRTHVFSVCNATAMSRTSWLPVNPICSSHHASKAITSHIGACLIVVLAYGLISLDTKEARSSSSAAMRDESQDRGPCVSRPHLAGRPTPTPG